MTNEELMKKYGAKFDAMFDAKPGAILKRKKRKRSKAHNPVPDLLVDSGNLPGVAKAVRDLLAKSGSLFDRGVPVRLVPPANGGSPTAVPLSRQNVVMETHDLCRPVKVGMKDEHIAVTLPERVAAMYLDMGGEWNLPPLNGISTAPALTADGEIRAAHGYDKTTGLWCVGTAVPEVPAEPSRQEAEAALKLLRSAFRTFAFADAHRVQEGDVAVVDLNTDHPGQDESAFLTLLLTAVCRPSLWLAPGALFTTPAISGAGTGKGLLVRAICAIAFGIKPRAFVAGHDRQELDKRIAAELIEAHPVLFLDNVNGTALHSDVLASAITERPARARVLGQSRMVELNSTAFIAVTGNGLTVTEDLARRFVLVEMDARCEDPESRSFTTGSEKFLDEMMERRAELLAAVLTIWRWGRQNAPTLKRGKTLGSFETWAEWCRDPLVTLGCRDPVQRIEAVKARDPHRQRVADLFVAWWEYHEDRSVRVSDLAEAVTRIVDPQGRGRQYLAAKIAGYAQTRAAGFLLTRQEAAGKWNAATYALQKIEPGSDGIGHRTHRTHRADPAHPDTGRDPMPPMSPMPYGVSSVADGNFAGPRTASSASERIIFEGKKDDAPPLGPPGDSLSDFDGGDLEIPELLRRS